MGMRDEYVTHLGKLETIRKCFGRPGRQRERGRGLAREARKGPLPAIQTMDKILAFRANFDPGFLPNETSRGHSPTFLPSQERYVFMMALPFLSASISRPPSSRSRHAQGTRPIPASRRGRGHRPSYDSMYASGRPCSSLTTRRHRRVLLPGRQVVFGTG